MLFYFLKEKIKKYKGKMEKKFNTDGPNIFCE